MAEATVGLDIGTTSVKGVVVDADGEVLRRVRVPHEIRVPAPDLLEHDADAAWRHGPRAALRDLGAHDAAAVCVAAMVPSLTAVDRAGVPVTPGLLYGDARGRGGQRGAHPGASGEARAFLRWTAQQAPDAAGYWPAQAVANHALGGEAAIDMASAGSVYPLFDGTGWVADELAGAGVRPEQLPRVAGIGEAVGRLRVNGEGAAPLLASGMVDALGEQAVTDATEPGDVLLVLGTTLLIWAVTERWVEVPDLWSIPHPTPGRFLVGGASNAGGLFLDWVRRLTGDAPPPRDPEGLPVWAPYLRGERTPLHEPDLRGGLHGLDLTHGPGHVLRAAAEASGFVVRHHLDLIAAGTDTEPRRLVASGGGVNAEGWVRAIADATALPVNLVAVAEGGALGAAWVARMAAGLEADLSGATRWARTGRRVDPDPRWSEATAHRYARFRALLLPPDAGLVAGGEDPS